MRLFHRALAGAALLALLVAAALMPAQAGPDDPLPYPFKIGARWEYDVIAPAVGKVGRGVRYIEPGGVMVIQMEVSDSAKCGAYYYYMRTTPQTLEVYKATFEPSKGGEPFALIIDPPFPFFVNPEYDGPVDVRKTCRAVGPHGELLGEGPARFNITRRNITHGKYTGLYETLLDQSFHSGIAETSTVLMNPREGIVQAKVKLNFLVTVTWELTKFTPPPSR